MAAQMATRSEAKAVSGTRAARTAKVAHAEKVARAAKVAVAHAAVVAHATQLAMAPVRVQRPSPEAARTWVLQWKGARKRGMASEGVPESGRRDGWRRKRRA